MTREKISVHERVKIVRGYFERRVTCKLGAPYCLFFGQHVKIAGIFDRHCCVYILRDHRLKYWRKRVR